MIRLRFGFFGGTDYLTDPDYPAKAYFKNRIRAKQES